MTRKGARMRRQKEIKLCLRCNKNEAGIMFIGGIESYSDCNECLKELKQIRSKQGELGLAYEFMPDRIKEDRKKFKKDMLQPWREGEASREFIEAYPERSRGMFSKDEIKRAKNVWSDI